MIMIIVELYLLEQLYQMLSKRLSQRLSYKGIDDCYLTEQANVITDVNSVWNKLPIINLPA